MMMRNGNALLGSRFTHLARSKELAEESGVPLLAWVLIILALAAFVGFVMWWYRRYQAAQATRGPAGTHAEEIELPVPTAVEMAALAPVEERSVRSDAVQIGVSQAGALSATDLEAGVPEPPPALDFDAVPPAMPEPLPMPEIQPVEEAAFPPADAVVPAEPDDLVKIEGVGPKIASILHAAGITTFSQLAATGEGRLRELLVAANLRFIDPASWPDQARLAAAGDWAGFDALTRELRGGRRAPQP